MSDIQEEMPFLQHLAELRSVLVHIFVVLCVATICCFVESKFLFSLITVPIEKYFSEAQLIGTSPTEAFFTKLKVSLGAGILISAPFSFFQLWRFISPGLHESEQRFAIPFVLISTLFFISGVMFCYYAVLPFAFNFFRNEYLSIGVLAALRIGEILSFTLKLLLVFGAVFEMPILTFFFARLGVLTDKWLIEKFRYSILVIFVTAALFTPPDIITQVLLAVPLIVIYGLCILVAKFSAK